MRCDPTGIHPEAVPYLQVNFFFSRANPNYNHHQSLISLIYRTKDILDNPNDNFKQWLFHSSTEQVNSSYNHKVPLNDENTWTFLLEAPLLPSQKKHSSDSRHTAANFWRSFMWETENNSSSASKKSTGSVLDCKINHVISAAQSMRALLNASRCGEVRQTKIVGWFLQEMTLVGREKPHSQEFILNAATRKTHNWRESATDESAVD